VGHPFHQPNQNQGHHLKQVHSTNKEFYISLHNQHSILTGPEEKAAQVKNKDNA
jgi:hypothetical protein